MTQGGGTERFAALNAALCPDVVLLDIAARAVAEPLEVLVATSAGEPGMSHPRLVIRAAAGSTSRIIVRHLGDDAERLVNAVVDVEVGPDAAVHLYRLLDSGERDLPHRAASKRPSRSVALFVAHDAQLGAGLARLDLHARLAAPQAAAELTGLFLADGTRHLDTHVHVDHLAVGTRSLQDYRGIAAGRGRAVFNGKAVVHEDAQKSQARQTSRNLLLTPGAEIDTKPELEIYADDVQCSHGATTGQLDPAALFYLRSRGLTEIEARSALDPRLRRRRGVAHGPCAVRRRRCATRSTHASPRCWRPGRERCPRTAGAVAGRVADRRRGRASRLPDPRAPGERQAALLPRQRGLEPAAPQR